MDDRGLQGWAHDPFRLHESRYFSAGRPTKLVRDGNIESYDEPPSDTYDPADALAASAADRLGRGTGAPGRLAVAAPLVTITAPPPSQTVSFSSYVQKLGQATAT